VPYRSLPPSRALLLLVIPFENVGVHPTCDEEANLDLPTAFDRSSLHHSAVRQPPKRLPAFHGLESIQSLGFANRYAKPSAPALGGEKNASTTTNWAGQGSNLRPWD
jgi:hypothetical protein